MAALESVRAPSSPLGDDASADYESLPGDTEERLTRRRSLGRRRWLLVAAVLVACGVGSFLAVEFRQRVLSALYWLGRRPPNQGGLMYAGLLALWLTALFPTSVLEVAAGFTFGFWPATFWSTIGKWFGSCASFGLACACRGAVRRSVLPAPGEASREHGYLRGLELAIKLEPFRTNFALRLAFVPEAIQNYVPALFEAPFPAFAGATLLGSVPYSMLWAHLGCTIGSAREIAKDRMSPEKLVFFAVGALSLVLLFALIHWNTKRTLARFAQLQLHENAEASPPVSPVASASALAPLVVSPGPVVATRRSTPVAAAATTPGGLRRTPSRSGDMGLV